MRRTQPRTAGFANGGRPEPRNVGYLESEESKKTDSPLELPERNIATLF